MTMSINSNYYDTNAESFIADTFSCDMSVQYNFFEKYLGTGNKILMDLGFGSGRDSLYFKSKGYTVYSIDPSKEFCDNARKLGLSNVYQLSAQNIDFVDIFDGIWACASLLHIPSNELNEVFKRCTKSLKANGIMYVSFKYGNFEGERNGRFFLDLDEASLKSYLKDTNLDIIGTLITEDVRPDKTTKWLNAILIKTN